MDFSGVFSRRTGSAAAVVLCAIGLSGCFDLSQRVAINREGGGTYAVEIAANGIVGDGLDRHHADVDIGDNRAVTRVSHRGDRTVQTSEIAFNDLSDLKLSDETISLHVKGKKFLGLGGTEVNFHRSFRVDSARHHHDEDDGDHIGHDVLTSMFGDHAYTFSVWLPGSIEHVAPVVVRGRPIYPQVWSDRYGHTIIWKMKLVDMFLADRLDFDVDFVAHGDFHDTETRWSPHSHHET